MERTQNFAKSGRKSALFVCALAAIAAMSSCKDESEPPDDPASEAPADSSYQVRGIVIDLPDPDRPQSDFVVKHEAIGDWARPDGTFGMPAMQMPFVSEMPTDFSGVSIGDKIEFTWISWWEPADDGPNARTFIRDIKVLDPDTPLELPGG